MCGFLNSGKVDENYIEYSDEIHFVINVDNGRNIGFYGSSDVKYVDLVMVF